jgi:hypothetical protein
VQPPPAWRTPGALPRGRADHSRATEADPTSERAFRGCAFSFGRERIQRKPFDAGLDRAGRDIDECRLATRVALDPQQPTPAELATVAVHDVSGDHTFGLLREPKLRL